MTPNDPLAQISDTLRKEHGGGFGFVCIWRPDDDDSDSHARRGVTVGEWLGNPEHQSGTGTWLIDGGLGGPPGPIEVRWNGAAWENGGYNGWRFKGARTHGPFDGGPFDA